MNAAPYVSPFGKPRGLARRLAEFTTRICSGTDRHLWAGLGIIEDIRLVAQILNKREWLEALRVGGDPEAARFAAELLDDDETLDAVQSAASRVQTDIESGLSGAHAAHRKLLADPVATIEQLDAAAVEAQRDYRAVRDVLVSCGALADDDEETPVADLVRALLS